MSDLHHFGDLRDIARRQRLEERAELLTIEAIPWKAWRAMSEQERRRLAQRLRYLRANVEAMK